MTIDDIFDIWAEDSQIDKTELSVESLKTPDLYNKYLKIYTNERLVLSKRTFDYNSAKKERWEYYAGKSDVPHPLKILRQDVQMYLDADEELTKKKLILDYQKEKLGALEKILKSLERRGFAIGNAIKWELFTSGGSY